MSTVDGARDVSAVGSDGRAEGTGLGVNANDGSGVASPAAGAHPEKMHTSMRTAIVKHIIFLIFSPLYSTSFKPSG